MARKSDSFLLRGGLDLVTSPLAVKPGRLWTGLNYEPVEAGYRRLRGYERKDGRPSPSEATYSILAFDAASAVPDDGDTLTGATSGATAFVVADPVIESGSVGGGDAAGHYVVSDIDGTFQDGEALGGNRGSVNGLPVALGADTIALDLAYRHAAAARRRALIAAVPGSGPVRGVWVFGNALYAVRDNAGATAGVLHKATATGWQAMALGHRIAFDGGTTEPQTGAAITGQTSGATATLGYVVVTSGSWEGDDAAGTMWLTGVNGAFQDDENLRQGVGAAPDVDLRLVTADVGGGRIGYAAEAIANAGVTAAGGSLEGAAGIIFSIYRGTGGSTTLWLIAEGSLTLAAVHLGGNRIALTEGSSFANGSRKFWSATGVSFPAGWTDPAGLDIRIERGDGMYLNAAGEWGGTTSQGGATVAVADGAASANALPAGGRYEFVNHNFKGQAASRRMYGVNGAGKAFHFDGSQFVSVSTGQPDDKPTHIGEQHNHLLLSYRGGSLVGSETGSPDGYSATKGAFELAAGQDILGLVGGVGLGNTLVVGDDHMQVLYGKDSSDFELIDQSAEQTGGVEWTAQSVGGPLYMDNRGVRSFTTTDAYGNFVIGTMTAAVQPWMDLQREEKNLPIGSMRVRSSDQYRVFFESGLGLIVYLGRGRPELSLIDYGVPVRCSVSAEDSDRIERVYFGSDDGWVYEAERGRSFDGEEIQAYSRMPLNHGGSPTRQKRYFGADLHMDLGSAIEIEVSALFDDGNAPEALADDQTLYGGGGLWEEAVWDEFYWDSPLNGYGSFDLDGIGRNVSILIASRTDREAPHTLNGVTLHWAPRRAER